MHPKQILANYNLEPKKSLGQNFLFDEKILAQIVDWAGLTTEDQVLEIGPGLGSLTRQLAERGFDLIVMATHGHTGLQHVLIGSTTERVVRGADCPVVTVRDHGPGIPPAAREGIFERFERGAGQRDGGLAQVPGQGSLRVVPGNQLPHLQVQRRRNGTRPAYRWALERL